MALISFVLDLAIEKCQTGEYKYYHTKTQLRDIVVQKFVPIAFCSSQLYSSIDCYSYIDLVKLELIVRNRAR